MADDNEQYELKTVRAIRGAEALTTAKWRKEGWEFVSQDKGTLRTEITFRRLKRKLPLRLVAMGAAAVALLIALAFTTGLFQDDGGAAVANPVAAPTDTPPTDAAPTEQPSTPSATAVATPSEQPSETAATAPEAGATITVENNTELAAILGLGEYCSETIAEFAAKYQGRTITFDGNIATMNPHGNATTRYDILLGVGNYSETTAIGPAFQFRDVNTTNDLHLAGDNVPDTIGKGDNLRVTAQVGEYEDRSCLFLLEPVSTEFR